MDDRIILGSVSVYSSIYWRLLEPRNDWPSFHIMWTRFMAGNFKPRYREVADRGMYRPTWRNVTWNECIFVLVQVSSSLAPAIPPWFTLIFRMLVIHGSYFVVRRHSTYANIMSTQRSEIANLFILFYHTSRTRNTNENTTIIHK